MSITYATLFGQLGKNIKTANDLLSLANQYRGIGAEATAILDLYNSRRDIVTSVGLLQSFDGLAAGMAGQVGQCKAVVDATLSDLQLALNAPDNSTSTILPLMAADMVANSQTVKASTVGVPTLAAVAGNVGSGALAASKIDNLGRTAEVSITEVVRLACSADQYGGATAGGETFSVVGYPTLDANTYGTRGNGSGDSVSVMNEGGANLLANSNFDTFSVANTPDGWTVDAGTVGTNILSSATIHAPTGLALLLEGNGSLPTATLHQSLAGLVSTNTRYVMGVFLRKGGGAFAAGSTLAIRVTGTGFTTQNLYSADPSTLTTGYVLSSLFFNVGATIPADLKLEITWTSAGGVAATGGIFIDDLVLAPAYVFGGIYYGLFRGSADFVVGDAFTSTTSNGYQGVFATYFSRFYGFQLPTATGGAETIADTLAT
jgi:hypothetical protein